MKIKDIDFWNSLKKDEETDVQAITGDLVCLINGVAFLIQREGNKNNVVCIRVNKSKKSILQTFETFRAMCQKEQIQYFRVEGISHTYKMLYLVCREGRKNGADCDVVYSKKRSEENKRHIFLVKSY